jgi:tRNA(fMet)-specific endonuclease VapC
MLDTNICSYIIRNKPETIKEKLKMIEKNNTIALSSIVASELFYGAKKKGSEKLYDLVLTFVENFEIFGFDKNSALAYAKIRVDLESRRNIIGSNDLLIAAHAKGCDAILVTNNTREFEKVNGLSIENWVL